MRWKPVGYPTDARTDKKPLQIYLEYWAEYFQDIHCEAEGGETTYLRHDDLPPVSVLSTGE